MTDREAAPTEIQQEYLHASCVALNGRAVLISGASGSGKSALALELMSRGADLVSDDQTIIYPDLEGIIATAPSSIRGQIEARGVGILKADEVASAVVALVVDLDQQESERLPGQYTFSRFGITLPLLYHVPHPHFAPAILQFLKTGRSA